MPKRSSTGRKDLSQIAKSIVDQATGEAEPVKKQLSDRKADSQKGGLRGGKSRMEKLTPEERKELARKAALARWGKTALADEASAGTTRSTKQR